MSNVVDVEVYKKDFTSVNKHGFSDPSFGFCGIK